MNDSPEEMSFLEHLQELRKRLIHIAVYVLIAFLVCWFFAEPIFSFLKIPIMDALPEGSKELHVRHLTEGFLLYMKVAFIAGIFFSSPLILTEVWLFISPGLYKREKRLAIPFIFFSSLFFIGGGVFGYYIAFPRLCNFLLTYAQDFQKIITAREYFSFLSKILLGLGIVFEIPILIFFLARLGIVTHRFLLKKFKYAILIIFIIAAVITPTPDIPTQMIFASPMIGLYLLGILVAWLFGKERKKEEDELAG